MINDSLHYLNEFLYLTYYNFNNNVSLTFFYKFFTSTFFLSYFLILFLLLFPPLNFSILIHPMDILRQRKIRFYLFLLHAMTEKEIF